jgi:hypothetical protein
VPTATSKLHTHRLSSHSGRPGPDQEMRVRVAALLTATFYLVLSGAEAVTQCLFIMIG